MGTQHPKKQNFLYLEQITLRDAPKLWNSLSLYVGNVKSELHRKGDHTWTPTQRQDVSPTSRIEVVVYSVTYWPKWELSEVIDLRGVFSDYWSSNNQGFTVLKTIANQNHSGSLEVKFLANDTGFALRSWLHELQGLLKEYSPLMGGSMEKTVDKTNKYGAISAELNPIIKAVLGVARATVELLKEQNKYDQMLSGLCDRVQRILPLAKQVNEIISEERKMLNELIPRMFEAMYRAAELSCNYVKRARRIGGLHLYTNKIAARSPTYPNMIEEMERKLNKIIESTLVSIYVVNNPDFWADNAERTVRELAPAEALVQALVQAERALVQPAKRAQAAALQAARAQAQKLLAKVWDWVWEGLAQVMSQAPARMVTWGEVLADSTVKEIIYSIEPRHRHRLARDLWPHSEHWWLIQIIVPITRLPPELLHQIFLITIDEASDSPLALMRVSQHWYNIVTGIWASLRLGTTTPKDTVTSQLERNQWFLDVLVDTEIDRGDFTPSEGAYQAIFAVIQATARWRSLVIETFPAQADLPEHLVNHSLQQCSNAVMSRLRTFKIKCPCEMSPLLGHLLRILGKSASEDLTVVEINSPSVISFLAPTYPSIFHSVKVLCLNTPRLPNPVDILPHLHQLEEFTASHLSLPIYQNHVNIPFVHTLRRLTLRAVSIQWMSSRTFHALESCIILFPLRHQVLHSFSTTLPYCKDLTFQGYPLETLHGVSAHRLAHLSVTCSCSDKSRGSGQLLRFSSQALRESRLAPRILHISIEATNQAWIKAFASMSNLEELVIHSAQPSSLGVKALQSLVVHPIHANKQGTTATPGEQYAPMCPSLKRFVLRYRRWLRPTEHFDVLPELVSIILSRQQSKFSLQSFRIWKGSDQKDSLELIEGSWISLKAFERLANDGAIKGGDLLQLVASRLVEKMFKPYSLPYPGALVTTYV